MTVPLISCGVDVLSDKLQKKFGYEYFHGRGSSYPKSGYETADLSYLENYVDFFISIKKGHVREVKWLDIGCAYGFLVYIASKHGIDCYGVDCSEYAINMGKKLYPSIQDKLFVCESDEVLDQFGEHSFDVISLIAVVEHLPHPFRSLSIISKCVRPRGLMLLSTPTYQSAQLEDDTHISVKTLTEWKEMLQALGYSVKAPYALVDPTKPCFNPFVRFLTRPHFLAELYRQVKQRLAFGRHTQIFAEKCQHNS